MNDIEIYNDDCLNIMPKIKDKSIDCIICDLPYGTTACQWDVIIPFEDLWREYKRIIRDNGAIVLFGSEPFSSLLICSNIQLFSHSWIWKKEQGTNFLNSNISPLKIHENIMVFYNHNDIDNNRNLREYLYNEKIKARITNKQINELLGYSSNGSGMAGHFFKNDKIQFIIPNRNDYEKIQKFSGFFKKSYDELIKMKENDERIFNHQFLKGKSYIAKQGNSSDCYNNKNNNIVTKNDGIRFPISVIEFDRDKEKFHPTQKPVKLLEYLVKTYTNEGDLVLDNCMGSGTTGIACKNLNRRFIGIEKDKKYFEIAKMRIEKVKKTDDNESMDDLF